jgi:hypothetical protein
LQSGSKLPHSKTTGSRSHDCSPTSEKQSSVVSYQWSVEPAKKRQAVTVNAQVGDAVASFM